MEQQLNEISVREVRFHETYRCLLSISDPCHPTKN